MNRRFIYGSIFLVLYVFLHAFISPYFHEVFSHYHAHLYTFTLSTMIYLLLVILILIEGRSHLTVIVIGLLLIATRCIDVVRYYMFPERTMEGNLLSFWGGVFMFAFALGYRKDSLFRTRSALYFLFVGILTTIRFPYFVDMFYYYYQKFGPIDDGVSMYYHSILFVHYIIVALSLLALDGIIQNNIDLKKYIK